MTKVLADNYPRSISQYVPVMEFAADVVDGVHIVSLGAPSAADPNGILSGASATSTAVTSTSADFATTFDGSSTHVGESVAGSINARYGRCLTAVGTAGSNHVLTITGRDYLGQIMSEALTLSGTSTIYGEKAFKFVDTIAAAAGASGDTYDLGWDDRLGLPYAAHQVISWQEDNVLREIQADTITVVAVDGVSADTVFGAARADCWVTGMDTAVAVATQSGDTVLTVEIGGTAVAGLSVTVAASSGIGTLDGDNSITNDHGTTSALAQNALLEVVSDGGTATTGTIDCFVHVQNGILFTDADDTTATTTTGDTRGTVQPHTACDASVVYEVRYTVDTSNLHGVAQA